MIESHYIYRVNSGEFVKNLFLQFGKPWLYLFSILIAGAIVATFVLDFRWAILLFFILLIIFPAVMAFLYFSHALTRECFINTLPHSVNVIDDRLVIKLFSKTNKTTENNTESEIIGTDETDNNTYTEYQEIRTESFDKNMITGYKFNIDSIIIFLADRHSGFLIVPFNAFDNDSEYRAFSEWIKC